jgi:hypothetical protein
VKRTVLKRVLKIYCSGVEITCQVWNLKKLLHIYAHVYSDSVKFHTKRDKFSILCWRISSLVHNWIYFVRVCFCFSCFGDTLKTWTCAYEQVSVMSLFFFLCFAIIVGGISHPLNRVNRKTNRKYEWAGFEQRYTIGLGWARQATTQTFAS